MVDVEKIKNARKKAKLTQRELADLIHLSQGYIGDIERGRSNPSIETLQLIAEALSVDVAEFLGNGSIIRETGLSTEEVDLVMVFRSLTDSDKELTKTMMQRFIIHEKKAKFCNSNVMIKKEKSAQLWGIRGGFNLKRKIFILCSLLILSGIIGY